MLTSGCKLDRTGLWFANLNTSALSISIILVTPSNVKSWSFLYLVGGWALPLWKMMDFVSWDDDIPNIVTDTHLERHLENALFF